MNTLLFCLFWGGCGGIIPGSPPTVHFSQPTDGASDVPLNAAIAVTFSEEMDPKTITTDTFFLDKGATGTVSYAGLTATFTPAGPLDPSTPYTATVTIGVKDRVGNPLEADHHWAFTTGTTAATGTSADVSLPRVLSTAPGLGEKGVVTNAVIRVCI